MEHKEIIEKKVKFLMDFFIKDSHKTDLESQILCIEKLQNNIMKTPLTISILSSLKELRGIKKNNIPKNG